MKTEDARLEEPCTSLIGMLPVVRNCQPANTAGRARGAFVVASFNLLIVANVLGAMMATGSGVTFAVQRSASRSKSWSYEVSARPLVPMDTSFTFVVVRSPRG